MRPSYPFKTDVKSARFSLLNLYSIHQSQCSKFYFVFFFFLSFKVTEVCSVLAAVAQWLHLCPPSVVWTECHQWPPETGTSSPCLRPMLIFKCLERWNHGPRHRCPSFSNCVDSSAVMWCYQWCQWNQPIAQQVVGSTCGSWGCSE